MARVGLILHHGREAVAGVATEIATWLAEVGHEVRLPAEDARLAGLEGLAHPAEEFSQGLEVAVSLGGDGTMLRAVDLVAPDGVPVIGVNFGQLGYLTEVEPGGLRHALERFFAGDYQLEHRMMLAARLDAPGSDHDGTELTAFNEVLLERSEMGHTVRLDVTIDGLYFTPYAADGLIVATATGSTAYSFSARGPIMAPTLRAMLLTPVSPHMLFDRPLVLHPDTELRLTVSGHRDAVVSVDGKHVARLGEGQGVRCRPAPFDACLVTFTPRDFHLILKAKFGLNDR